MNRLVALLLIPMFMLGQPLPHSHAGVGVDQPDDHAARPHVHLSQQDHQHGHSHSLCDHQVDHQLGDSDHSGTLDAADDVVTIFGLNGHDDDAFYLANLAFSHCRLSNGGQQNHFTVLDFNARVFSSCRPISDQQSLIPSQRYSSLPIYLLTASLRL